VACPLSAIRRGNIPPMPRPIALTPIHGEYRKRGDKID